jgi:hypothetical protein
LHRVMDGQGHRGPVATVIMILATLTASQQDGTIRPISHDGWSFLFITLGLTCGPTFYIAIAEHNGDAGSLTLVLGIVQFFISAVATLLFAITAFCSAIASLASRENTFPARRSPRPTLTYLHVAASPRSHSGSSSLVAGSLSRTSS